MKKNLLITVLLSIFLMIPLRANAQMMGGFSNPGNEEIAHTLQDEQAGQKIYTQLQNNSVSCSQLTNDDYEKLGEYFMSLSFNNTMQHTVANLRMQSMMGQQGEEQMHIVMGERLSGCNTNVAIPNNGQQFLPMFNFQRGGASPMMGFGWPGMMGGYSYGWGGILSMILFLGLLILAVVFLIRYIGDHRSHVSSQRENSTEILKTRYAKGEIDRKEYEEKKKDLGIK